jgi:hypothetical protein
MVYGKTPFSTLPVIGKLQKIIDSSYPIEFAELSNDMNNPFLVDVMKSCLRRDIKRRMTIPDLLHHPFLKPDQFMTKLMAKSKADEVRLNEIETLTRALQGAESKQTINEMTTVKLKLNAITLIERIF